MNIEQCPRWLYEQAASQHYDLTLLLDIDVPWVDDDQRDLAHKRQEFFELCRSRLEEYGRKYVIISGSWEERFTKAIRAVDKIINNK